MSLTRCTLEVSVEKTCEKSSWRNSISGPDASRVTTVLSNWTWYFAYGVALVQISAQSLRAWKLEECYKCYRREKEAQEHKDGKSRKTYMSGPSGAV